MAEPNGNLTRRRTDAIVSLRLPVQIVCQKPLTKSATRLRNDQADGGKGRDDPEIDQCDAGLLYQPTSHISLRTVTKAADCNLRDRCFDWRLRGRKSNCLALVKNIQQFSQLT